MTLTLCVCKVSAVDKILPCVAGGLVKRQKTIFLAPSWTSIQKKRLSTGEKFWFLSLPVFSFELVKHGARTFQDHQLRKFERFLTVDPGFNPWPGRGLNFCYTVRGLRGIILVYQHCIWGLEFERTHALLNIIKE